MKQQTKLFKILGIMLASLILLAGCSNSSEETPVASSTTTVINDVTINSTMVDMSDYEDMPVAGHQFEAITPSEFVRVMEAGVSGYFYFGYHSCPFCNKATSVLNEAAADEDVTIYYINVYPDEEPENFDEDMDAVLNALSDVLDKDESGNPEFYVPHLFVIENGEVIDQHVSLVDSYQGSGADLTTAQHNELVGIYKDMIEELK